jgi:hypothetical protein
VQTLGLRRIFTKLEQRSWLKIEAGRGKSARENVTERFVVQQHYRIGQLQGRVKPSALDGRM